MTEKKKLHPFIDTSVSSSYMYRISMVVQVIAPTRELADAKLDQEGGYVSKREVEFVRSVVLYKEEEDQDVDAEELVLPGKKEEEEDEDYA